MFSCAWGYGEGDGNGPCPQGALKVNCKAKVNFFHLRSSMFWWYGYFYF